MNKYISGVVPIAAITLLGVVLSSLFKTESVFFILCEQLLFMVLPIFLYLYFKDDGELRKFLSVLMLVSLGVIIVNALVIITSGGYKYTGLHTASFFAIVTLVFHYIPIVLFIGYLVKQVKMSFSFYNRKAAVLLIISVIMMVYVFFVRGQSLFFIFYDNKGAYITMILYAVIISSYMYLVTLAKELKD